MRLDKASEYCLIVARMFARYIETLDLSQFIKVVYLKYISNGLGREISYTHHILSTGVRPNRRIPLFRTCLAAPYRAKRAAASSGV